jgi:hypothetical protein
MYDESEQSQAVRVALTHIDAWSHHDWKRAKELLATNVHALVTATQPNLPGAEFTGVEKYMELLTKSVQLIEPESVKVISTIGDKSNALIVMTFRIGLGPGGTMVNMARASLYLLDENGKIREERGELVVLQ